MEILFKEKLTEAYLDLYFEEIPKTLATKERIILSLKQTEWISTEGLAFLYSWLYLLFSSNKDFQVFLPTRRTQKGSDLFDFLYGYCQIYSFLEPDKVMQTYKNLDNYFPLDAGDQEHAKDLIKKKKRLIENTILSASKYNLVLPLKVIKLPVLSKTESIELLLQEVIDDLFVVEDYIQAQLDNYTLNDPIDNNILSHIITWELLQNSLEHAYEYKSENKFVTCVVGITKEKKSLLSKDWLNSIYRDEKSIELHDFFKSGTSDFINTSYLEFSFVDMGMGIANSLRLAYERKQLENGEEFNFQFNKNHSEQVEDTKILEYAFVSSSSSIPLSEKIENYSSIPRGLYYLVDYIDRYEGLLIVRSNKGKIVYDFGKAHEHVKEVVKYSSYKDLPKFNGSLISIYLPAITKNHKKEGTKQEKRNKIRITASRPTYKIDKSLVLTFNEADIYHISLCEEYFFVEKEIIEKEEYLSLSKTIKNSLIEEIDKKLQKISSNVENGVVFINFSAFTDIGITKKLFYYFTTTPYINLKLRCIITGVENEEVITFFNNETRQNKQIPFIYRPIPIIDFNYPVGDLNKIRARHIKWIGVKNAEYEAKLTNLFLTDPLPSYTKETDFKNISESMEEHFIIFDDNGNIKKFLFS